MYDMLMSVYVKSEKSATRVLATITEFIEEKLKLRVNGTKSKVSCPTESTLLGFSFYRKAERWEIRIAPKSLKKIRGKMKAQTQRKAPGNVRDKVKKMEATIIGWVNYFRIAKAKSKMEKLDSWVRMRLRMGIWKQWKRPATRMRNLKRLGISTKQAYEWANTRKGYCCVAHSKILLITLNNDYFARQGYIGFTNHYYWKTTHQTKLF